MRAHSQSALPAVQARPRLTGALIAFVFGKLLGAAILLGVLGLMYDLVSSPEFNTTRVTVAGNQLLATTELESLATANEGNAFWLRRAEIASRLRQLPPVERVEVSLTLPNQVAVRVKEREPVAIWVTGETPFLVDGEGVVLSAGPAARPLAIIRDASNPPLTPGQRVDADAVRTAARLEGLLSERFGAQERQCQYAPETGLQVIQTVGPRLIIGSGEHLAWKIASIESIVRHLEASRTSAELIDVRFGDRPYFR
jgi:hypothetical protein